MDPITIAALVGAGTSLVSTASNWFSQDSTNDSNYQHDVDMANLSYELNEQAASNAYARSIDQWEMEQAYNDPSAQRTRLEEAGINPAIAFGGTGTTSGNVSSSTNSAQGGANVSSTAGRAPMVDPQASLLAAQTAKTMAETKEIDAKTDTYDFQNKLAEAQTEFAKANAANTKVITQMNELTKELQSATLSNDIALSGASLKSLELANKNARATFTKIASEVGLNNSYITLTGSKIALNDALIRYNDQRVKQSKSAIQLNEAQIQNLEAISANTWQLLELNSEKTTTQQHLSKSAEHNSNIDERRDYRDAVSHPFDTLHGAVSSASDIIWNLLPGILRQ